MRIFFILISICFLFSCAKEKVELPEENPPIINEPPVEEIPYTIKYLALGDSYTIGQSVPVTDRYPIQLSTRLMEDSIEMDTTIIIAQTGWRTDNLNDGIINANLTDTFELVSLLIGVNNFYQGRSIEEYEEEFEGLLQTAINFAGGEKDHVFVLSIPDYAYTPFGNGNSNISQGIDDFNAVNKTITDSLEVSYFDITAISRQGLDQPDLVASDGLHPSGEQYERWVDLIYNAVKIKTEK